MTHKSPVLAQILDDIDAVNAQDPTQVGQGDAAVPAELLYGRRMSEILDRFCPDASEPLEIATRGQHIERWIIPRSDYPEGRTGYLQWRTALKNRHAERVAGLMQARGYAPEIVDRTQAIIRKERLKYDADAQTLEDVACLVFLEHYLVDFAARHDDDKLADILAKTWHKMSPAGHEAALRLPLPASIPVLLQKGLEKLAETKR